MPKAAGPDGPAIGATVFSDPAVKAAVEDVIVGMMKSVMEKVLVADPFDKDRFRREKPLYAALVPDEIFLGSHFERRFVTPFGKVWERLVQVLGQAKSGFAATDHEIRGRVRQGRLDRIHETLDRLERGPNRGGAAPNWKKELAHVRECREGAFAEVRVICDVFIAESAAGRGEMFEVKAALPNSDQSKVSKEKLLKLHAMEPPQVNGAYYALPYNPYGRREDYDWNPPHALVRHALRPVRADRRRLVGQGGRRRHVRGVRRHRAGTGGGVPQAHLRGVSRFFRRAAVCGEVLESDLTSRVRLPTMPSPSLA